MEKLVFFCVNRQRDGIAFGISNGPNISLDPDKYDNSRLQVYHVPEGLAPEEALVELRRVVEGQAKKEGLELAEEHWTILDR
jgi:hypothetical protein